MPLKGPVNFQIFQKLQFFLISFSLVKSVFKLTENVLFVYFEVSTIYLGEKISEIGEIIGLLCFQKN